MALSNRARKTLKAVFSHPLPRNLKWKDLIAMCLELGVSVREGEGRSTTFKLDGRVASAHKPHKKNGTDKGAIAAVRNLLDAAGITPEDQ